MKVKVINSTTLELPAYQTPQSAGMDIRANIDQDVVIAPLARAIVPTGLYVEIPQGYEIQIRPRSGLAAKHGVTVLNSPGTIDADYRGEIKVILVNLSDTDFSITRGERIAQMVMAQTERIEFERVDNLSQTERGEGGFGHTKRE